ncbi:unnamed protein product [Prorocentrum cordatum]|uniref:RNA-editing substrate-binding complex 6 protein domain-containing protein n=1 Tax=Prorocentrum cordatum TaxID=2364126 RepID=A0ABN9W2N9_9DINO|nr:unnamed protein product [Polarella glacialis]
MKDRIPRPAGRTGRFRREFDRADRAGHGRHKILAECVGPLAVAGAPSGNELGDCSGDAMRRHQFEECSRERSAELCEKLAAHLRAFQARVATQDGGVQRTAGSTLGAELARGAGHAAAREAKAVTLARGRAAAKARRVGAELAGEGKVRGGGPRGSTHGSTRRAPGHPMLCSRAACRRALAVRARAQGRGFAGGGQAETVPQFWREYKDLEAKRRRRQPAAGEKRRHDPRAAAEEEPPLFGGRQDLDELLRGQEAKERHSAGQDRHGEARGGRGPRVRVSRAGPRKQPAGAGPEPEDDLEVGIREVQPDARQGGGDAPLPAMPPGPLGPAAQRLLACRSAGALLAEWEGLAAAEPEAEAPPGAQQAELVLALQLLGRWAGRAAERGQLLRDARLARALEALQRAVPWLEPWALAGGLWGCAGLGGARAAAECSQALVRAAAGRLPELGAEEAGLALRALARGRQLHRSKDSLQLRDGLVAAVIRQGEGLGAPGAAALAPALVQLRVTEPKLLDVIARRVGQDGRTLQVQDMAAASASLAALRVFHPTVTAQALKSVEAGVHLCTPRGVVQFCVALWNAEDPAAFRDFLQPAARSFMMDFGARDLCTVAEAFCRAQVSDADFLADLAFSLTPKIGDMGAHEVSVALNVFAPVAYTTPELLPGVAGRARTLVDELSPRQVARTLRGLAKCGYGDAALFAGLRERAVQLARVLYGTHATDALLALAQAGHLDGPSVSTLLGVVGRSLGSMTPIDHVAVLYAVAQLPPDLQMNAPEGLVDELLLALRRKRFAEWRMDPEALVHLLQALRGLRMQDEVLLDSLLERLPRVLRYSECSQSLPLLVQLVDCLGDLPSPSSLQVRMHLHRRPKLLAALKECLGAHFNRKLDLESGVVLARALARTGYEDAPLQDWLDRLIPEVEARLEFLDPSLVCDLCFALAEMNWNPAWNLKCVRRFVRKRYPDRAVFGAADASAAEAEEEDDEREAEEAAGAPTIGSLAAGACSGPLPGEALLRLAWALVALNEELPAALLEELHAAFGGSLPEGRCGTGLRLLQDVAQHHGLAKGAAERLPELPSAQEQAPAEVVEWLSLAREVPRGDLFASQQPPRAQRRERRLAMPHHAYPYEQWLSGALRSLRIPHEAGAPIGPHRVAVKFRRQRHAIDVLGLADISAPSRRTRGAAEVRRRQLMQLGWVVHPLTIFDLYNAVRSGSARLLVSKLLSSFDPDAARRASFRGSSLRPARAPSRAAGGEDPDGWLPDDAEGDAAEDPDMPGVLGIRHDPRATLQARAALAAAGCQASGSGSAAEVDPCSAQWRCNADLKLVLGGAPPQNTATDIARPTTELLPASEHVRDECGREVISSTVEQRFQADGAPSSAAQSPGIRRSFAS